LIDWEGKIRRGVSALVFNEKDKRGEQEETHTHNNKASRQKGGERQDKQPQHNSKRTMANRPFLSSLSCSFFRLCSSFAKLRGSNLKSPGCVSEGWREGREGGRKENEWLVVDAIVGE